MTPKTFTSAPSSGDSSDFGDKDGTEIGFESREARFDSGIGCALAGEGIGGFQAVAGDAQDGSFVGMDAALGDEFLRDRGGDAAGSLRENSFGFGQRAHADNNFGIGNIFGPAARSADDFHGVVPVGRIADGQGARNRVGLLRIEAVFAVLDRVGNGRAARGLRAEKFHGLGVDQSQGDKLVEGFFDFRQQRAAGHGNDNVVGQTPAKLLGDFKADRFRAFGVIGAQIHVHKSPVMLVGDLRAEAVDLVVVPGDAYDSRAINLRGDYFGG